MPQDLQTAKVKLGSLDPTFTELPFRRLKKVLPLIAAVMPQLAAGTVTEAVFDAMLGVVLLSQAEDPKPYTREQLENEVIRPDQLAEACRVIAKLCALDQTPEGDGGPKAMEESASTGTTSTLS